MTDKLFLAEAEYKLVIDSEDNKSYVASKITRIVVAKDRKEAEKKIMQYLSTINCVISKISVYEALE